jgi:hypothetical protein
MTEGNKLLCGIFIGPILLIVYLWRHRKDRGIGWYRGCGLPSPHEGKP